MNHFGIKDIEALTGIKPHTLRIWEQRYELIQPKRTESNIRYYTGEDLKLLLNVSFLNRQGIKISKISGMTIEEMKSRVHQLAIESEDYGYKVNLLLSCMLNLDEAGIAAIFNQSVNAEGLQGTMERLVFPFLAHIGLLWQAGSVNPGFEHFITNIIKSQILSSIQALPSNVSRADSKKFVLFLPDGEDHEIGLLFANYLIRREGHESIYLGQSMPSDDLKEIAAAYKAPFMFTSLVMSRANTDVYKLLQKFSEGFPEKQILVTGQGFLSLEKEKFPENVLPIYSCADFLQILK